MAEIRDVYSLEFNSGQFQSEVNSAIATIEELNAAMENGADVSEELASAQENLVSILATESKGIENLNAKRNVLVNTQKTLNKESQAGVAVGKQLTQTNQQLANETGKTNNIFKGFQKTLISGTRSISQMRRVASTLTFVFRSITAALPFGLILSFAGPIINFFTSWFKGADKTAENMDKLNDKTLSLGERLSIAQEELDKLNTIEGKRGKLTDEEIKRRKELTKVYEDTANEMIKIEEDRAERFRQIELSLAETKVRILGNTSAGVIASAELETKKLYNEIKKRVNDELKLIDEIYKERIEVEKEYNRTSSTEANIRLNKLKEQESRAFKAIELLTEEQSLREQAIEQEKNKKLADIAERARQEQERKEKEYRDRLKKLQDNSDKAVEKGIKKTSKEVLDAIERKKKAEEEYQKMLEESQKRLQDSINELKKRIESESDILENNRQAQLSMDLLQLEAERNQKLLYARQNITDTNALNEELERINTGYNKRREKLEQQTAQEIIKIQIDSLNKLRSIAIKQGDLLTVSEIDKQLAELGLKFEEFNRQIESGFDNVKEKVDYKELIDQTAQVIQFASDTVFSTLNAQLQGYIQNLDRAVDKSRTALDDIRQNSENFNARQLELEKERLERLEAERARAVEREKTLGQVQVAINAAIAISKAAAEGGGFASAFTIAATLASLIAGLAQARAAAGNAFFHGVEYLERGNNPRGRDTIPAMLNEGERVITTDTNAKYWDVLSAVHNNRIPADVLNSFANAYQAGGLRAALGAFGDNISLAGELGGKSVFVNVGQNFSGLENRLERIESVLTELPKYMPKTVVNANAKGIFRIVEQRQQRKNFSRNWAK